MVGDSSFWQNSEFCLLIGFNIKIFNSFHRFWLLNGENKLHIQAQGVKNMTLETNHSDVHLSSDIAKQLN